MTNHRFLMTQNDRGAVTHLELTDDPTQMNWVIDPEYLAETGYDDLDKLFGEFTITVDGQTINSIDLTPTMTTLPNGSRVTFALPQLRLTLDYLLTADRFTWQIHLTNLTHQTVTIDNLGVWASLAYVMFRDTNVKRNANQSVAVFPSISTNYTKLAAVRRDNTAPNLGVYQTAGDMRSVGTYNDYRNRFFENVSPSLDGMLFHQLILAGGYPEGNGPKHDWLYSQAGLTLDADATTDWTFEFAPFTDQPDFYAVGAKLGHPVIDYRPLVADGHQILHFDAASTQRLAAVVDRCYVDGSLVETPIMGNLTDNALTYQPEHLGEHQVIVTFTDGTTDQLIFNVMSSVRDLLRDRVDYISDRLYVGETGEHPYSFSPISNQGESLGKLNFVLQECLLDSEISDSTRKIQQVEASAVNYVRPKWFVNGDFLKPAKLYGDFYRVMDLEYIAHTFFLLSQCDASQLALNTPQTYLEWAATIFNVRTNPDLHEDERGKAESQMLGQYFLYINDLLAALKANGLTEQYDTISAHWQEATARIADQSGQLSAAMTEHFFDNAGFGPAAGALALSGHETAARRYGELLKANIGFSNDFRAQSPDRWWEALSYMMHSLWGGVTAASALMTGRALGDAELVAAGYRGTAALLYMYDSNATATDRQLEPGEAASTYSIAGPNLNRPDLSRNRFGQSIFASDGGIFTRLFPDGYTGEDDWDMGEELVAYLNGFGQEAYLYRDEAGDIQVINGRLITQTGDQLTLENAAPYPSRVIDLDRGTVFEVAGAQVTVSLK